MVERIGMTTTRMGIAVFALAATLAACADRSRRGVPRSASVAPVVRTAEDIAMSMEDPVPEEAGPLYVIDREPACEPPPGIDSPPAQILGTRERVFVRTKSGALMSLETETGRCDVLKQSEVVAISRIGGVPYALTREVDATMSLFAIDAMTLRRRSELRGPTSSRLVLGDNAGEPMIVERDHIWIESRGAWTGSELHPALPDAPHVAVGVGSVVYGGYATDWGAAGDEVFVVTMPSARVTMVRARDLVRAMVPARRKGCVVVAASEGDCGTMSSVMTVCGSTVASRRRFRNGVYREWRTLVPPTAWGRRGEDSIGEALWLSEESRDFSWSGRCACGYRVRRQSPTSVEVLGSSSGFLRDTFPE